MLALELLAWWYGAGWAKLLRTLGSDIRTIIQLFSVPILVRTWFAPWKRLVTTGTRSFGEQMRAVLDNVVSRFVGFMVRTIVLIAAGLMIALVMILGAVAVVVWPLVPLAGIALIVRGLL